MRLRTTLIVIVLASAGTALARPARPPRVPAATPAVPPPRPPAQLVIGATEALKVTAPVGFIDDVVAADADRLAYVVADGATRAALHVVTLATKDEQIVDLATVTLHPTALALVGSRVFVVGRAAESTADGAAGAQVAALIELSTKNPRTPAGTARYTLGPAAHITPILRDGKPRVAVHRVTPQADVTRHQTELVAIETGRRLSAGRPLDLDASGTSPAHELRVNHWSDGYTRAHGIKAGTWDRKENMRGPDVEATFDLVTGKLAKRAITDLFDQKRRFLALADAGGALDFARVFPDGTPQLWRAGKGQPLVLDHAFTTYDPRSLAATVLPDGRAWVALVVDPVNPDAVARQKADPQYLDVFRVTAAGQGSRVARVYAPGGRVRFGAAGERFWILERTPGAERGGTRLTLYQLP